MTRFFLPLMLVGVVVMYFSSMTIGDRSFTSDGQLAAYHQGLSFWSSDWAAGWPIIADPISMPLYPVRLAMVALGFPFDAFVVAAYVIAILGMYFFLRVIVDNGPALFGAVAFSLSGWMLVHLGHTSMVHAAAWLPWMMLGTSLVFLGAGTKRYRGVALLAGAVSMSVMAGHTQVTVYALFLVSMYALFIALVNRAWSMIPLVVVGLLCGIGVSAPVLLPTAEWTSFTYRSEMTAEQLFSYALPLGEIPALVVPLLYGATPFGWFGHGYHIPGYSGETITYFSAIGIFFAFIAISSAKNEGRHIVFWSLVGLLSLLLALGSKFPPAALLTEYLFPLNMFRVPSRHVLEVTFSVSVLSALGLQILAGRAKRAPQVDNAIFLTFLLFVLAVSAALATHRLLGLQLNQLVWPILFASLMFALSFSLTRLRSASGASSVLVGFSIAILGLNTVMIGYQLPWKVYAAPESHISPPAWVSDFKSKLGNDYRALGMNGWQSHVFNPDMSRLHGLRTMGWYGPLLNRSIAELTGLTTGGWVQRSVLSGKDVALDLLSVRYVAISENEKQLLEAHPNRWAFVKTYGNEYVFENLNVLPRARLACQISNIESDSVFNAAIRDGGRYLSVVDRVYSNDTFPDWVPSQTECAGGIEILDDNGDSVRMIANVNSDRAILVLSDLWYPGWRVYVNGSEKPVHRVNNTSRAVMLPNGNSSIEFVYRPTAFYLSISVFLLSGGVVAVLFLLPTELPVFKGPRKAV